MLFLKINQSIILGKRIKFELFSLRRKKTRIYSESKTQKALKYGDVRILKGKFPKTIIKISNANQNNRVHPTQKPVKLMEYLIEKGGDVSRSMLQCSGYSYANQGLKNPKRDSRGYFSKNMYNESII